MLSLDGVWKSFGGEPVLAGVDLEARPGETVALIGPSGCGKSTLLRLAVGLARPDRGEVRIDGARLEAGNAAALRRRIGYVIQGGGLFPHLTARGNAALQARYLGWSRERIADRLAELTALTHLPAELLGRFPAELSGGQKQRISLIRALMPDPGLLLLDEPLGTLDPIVRRDLQDELREIFSLLEKTVVLVTHDLGEAAFFSRSILAGIKTSAVINVGTATLGALIGAGGYGQPILTGIRLDDVALILEGAVPAALLALAAQGLFDAVERLVVPRGLRL